MKYERRKQVKEKIMKKKRELAGNEAQKRSEEKHLPTYHEEQKETGRRIMFSILTDEL